MQPSSQETCSWPHLEGRNGHEAGTTFALSPHLFKRLQEGQLSPFWGSFAMPGLCPLCCKLSQCPLRQACCGAQSARGGTSRVPSSEFNQAFFQPVTWLKLDSHLRNTTLQTPTKGPPSIGCANWNTNQRKKLSSV